MIDSSVTRAHQHAAGAKGGQNQAIGKSCGANSTKIKAAVDSLCNPARITITPGQDHDCTQAEALIDGLLAKHVIADKEFDTNDLRSRLEGNGVKAVISLRGNRKRPISCDKDLCKERNLVQRLLD